MTTDLEIWCLVIGFGDFGARAYENLKRVTKLFNERNRLVIKWHGVVETNEKRRKEIGATLAADGVSLFETLESALLALPNRDVRLFVHDLADNLGRLERLARILELPNSFILAEKPLLVARQQLAQATRLASVFPRFTVDFPENTKAVSRAAFSLLKDLVVTEITCFQINSLGEEKLLSPGIRPGVAGGSMLDKAPHPHAWCYAALSPVESVGIVGARAIHLMPYRLNAAGIYMDNRTGATTTSTIDAADAEGEAHLRYVCARQPRHPVDVRIVSGWRGVRADIREYISGLGLSAPLILNERKRGELGWFGNQEVRVKIVHGESHGNPVTLVVSTLPRGEQGIPPQAWVAHRAIAPYRFPVEEQLAERNVVGPIHWKPLDTDGQPESLDAMYENALLTLAGEADPLLGSADAVEIHRLIITCRETADQRLRAAA